METEIKIPEGYVMTSGGILLKAESPAVAALIDAYRAKKAAAVRKPRKAKAPAGFVVRGFALN